MISDIYNRPMFQTPERRAGGGIMAGVAPINQFMGPMRLADGGELGFWDWLGGGEQMQAMGKRGYGEDVTDFASVLPGVLSDMATETTFQDLPSISYDDGLDIDIPWGEGSFFSYDKTEPGTGINARDVIDALVVDPTDWVDIGMAIATAPLILYPPALMAASLARQGYKASKIKKALDKVVSVQEKMPNLMIGLKGPGRGSGWEQAQAARLLGQGVSGIDVDFISSAQASEPGETLTEEEVEEIVSSNPPETEVEEGGIEALVTESAPETIVEEGGISSLPTSIWQARDKNVKSPTFMRDGVPKAAVTVEDVSEAGFTGPKALTDYLNAMDFDEDSGRYVKRVEPENKAAGGIMNLNAGGIMHFSTGEEVISFLAQAFKRAAKAVKDKNLDEIRTLRREAAGQDLDTVRRSQLNDELTNAERLIKEEPTIPDASNLAKTAGAKVTDDAAGATKGTTDDIGESFARRRQSQQRDGSTTTTKSDKTPGDSGQDVGSGPGGDKPGVLSQASKFLGKYGAAGGVGYVIGDYFFNDTAEIEAALKAEQDKVNSNEQLIAQLKEALLEARNQSQVGPKDTTTEPPPPEGNIVQRMMSKLKNFNPNQKGLYIAGQMMKPVEGWTPVNALTQATEAGIAYDKSQSEMAKDRAAIEQAGTDLEREFFTLKSSAEKMLGRELKPTEQNDLILFIREDMQSRKDLMSLYGGPAPHLIKPETIKDLSRDKAANFVRGLQV